MVCSCIFRTCLPCRTPDLLTCPPVDGAHDRSLSRIVGFERQLERAQREQEEVHLSFQRVHEDSDYPGMTQKGGRKGSKDIHLYSLYATIEATLGDY